MSANRPQHFLLTPGPLTTSDRVKQAMLKDWGSWDPDFQTLTKSLRESVLKAAAADDHFTCVPLQGSGTFAVEAVINTLIGKTGKLLVLINGAYGDRIAKICSLANIDHVTLKSHETEATEPEDVAKILKSDPNISHVALVQCETSVGIMNHVSEIAAIVKQEGRRLIIDAMSAFGALQLPTDQVEYDAIIASSNKCLEGVPGMGFVVVKKSSLIEAKGRATSLSLDLVDQWDYMEKTGQWRYTPPTHVVAAFVEALKEYEEEGSASARLARYEANRDILVSMLREKGLKTLLCDEQLSPIIVTFLAPEHPAYDFKQFYEVVKKRGFIIYPGKMTEVESFRIGCIGHFDEKIMAEAAEAILKGLTEIGVKF